MVDLVGRCGPLMSMISGYTCKNGASFARYFTIAKKCSRLSAPAPCSVMLSPSNGCEASKSASLMNALFYILFLFDGSTCERARATLAETIEQLIDVPDIMVQPPSMPRPRMFWPSVNKSGLIMPKPSSSDQVDMPRLLKLATRVFVSSRLPTPITLTRSPGLFSVPWNGP